MKIPNIRSKKPGDPVSAREFNSLVNTVKTLTKSLLSNGYSGSSGSLTRQPKNTAKTQVYTVVTCINYASQNTYTLEIAGSKEIEVSAPFITYDGDGDLRHYIPWFPVGSGVEVIKEDGIWYIKETLIYVGDDEDSSLRWNETDERAMAVWK